MFINKLLFLDDLVHTPLKASHDVPLKPITVESLKSKVTQLSLLFGLTGDIDLDASHAFVYQINVFFPLKHNHQQAQC
jgi:hypothetical protein